MKRALSLILAILTCLSCCALLASCGHECEWAADWSKDATHHWKACTDAECAEVNEKAEHTWDAGVESAFGVTQYTCSVCAQTKTEEANTEVAADKWAEGFSLGENYKLSATMTVGNSTMSIVFARNGKKVQITDSETENGVTETDVEYIVESNNMLYEFEEYEGKIEKNQIEYASSITEFETMMLSEIILEQFRTAAGFTYNAETNLYTCADIQIGDTTVTNISLGFKDGKVAKIEYTAGSGEETAKMTAGFEYGTATVTVPAIEGATVTADQWVTAMNFTNGYYLLDQDTIYEDGSMDSQDIGYYGDIITVDVAGMFVYYVKDGNNYYMYTQVGSEYMRTPVDGAMFLVFKTVCDYNMLLKYADFTFDADIQAYVAATVTFEEVTMTNVQVHFNGGKVQSISYNTVTQEDRPGLVILTPKAESSAPELPQVD